MKHAYYAHLEPHQVYLEAPNSVVHGSFVEELAANILHSLRSRVTSLYSEFDENPNII